MNRTFLKLQIFIVIAALGCSSDESPPPPLPKEISNRDVAPVLTAPVEQVRQTLNLSKEETLRAAAVLLDRYNLPLQSIDPESGLIETAWKDIQDKRCGHRMQGAPLKCRATISLKVDDYEKIHSVVNARFQERCSMNEEVELRCAASEGERLMVSIIEELRAIDEAAAPKSGWLTITKPTHRVDAYGGE